MKVTGGATVHAPIAAVWAALTDPAVLVQAIPGCERLTATGQDTYELTVTAGVGTVTGTYTGQIALAGQQAPTALTLRASGSGSPGTVSTSVLVGLTEGEGGTLVSYDADATIGGLIAGVGQRMLAGAARRQATQFFAALDDLLLAQQAGLVGAGADGRRDEAAAGAPGTRAGTFPGKVLAGGTGGTAQPLEGVRTDGAAGVAPAAPSAPGVSGMTWERTTADRQPAGRLGARPPTGGFMQGVLVGAGVALAGVLVGGLISRRKR